MPESESCVLNESIGGLPPEAATSEMVNGSGGVVSICTSMLPDGPHPEPFSNCAMKYQVPSGMFVSMVEVAAPFKICVGVASLELAMITRAPVISGVSTQ